MSNINENLEKIQNAIYGEEVRGAIVDSIKQCYDDNAQEGNSNAEVISSRGNYRTLRERLDSLDYVSFTMQTDQEIVKNTDFEVPHEYKLGGEGLIILTEGSKLIKDINYVEIDSLHIQFKDWDVPIGTNLEFICNTNKVMQADEVYIKELEEENAAFKDLLPFGQKTGENITLEDSGEIKLKKLRIEGNTQQETREGYNLLDCSALKTQTISGVTFTVNKDKSITATGTAAENVTLNLVGSGSNFPLSLEAGNYMLSGCTNGSKDTYMIEIYNGTNYYRVTDRMALLSFTEDVNIRAYIAIKRGVTMSNVTFYPMLAKGTEIKGYEQYGAMPSMEFQSAIKSCENSINFTICNKNLITNLQNGHWDNKNKILTNTDSLIFKSFKTFVKAGTYTLSCNTKINIIRAFTEDNNSAYVVFLGETINVNSYTITIEKDTTLYLSVRRNDNTEWFNADLLQLEKSNVKTNYVEHKEQNYTFPLKQKLHKEDYLTEDGIHHNRKEIELDGATEKFKISSINRYENSLYYCTVALAKTAINGSRVCCSHFKNKNQAVIAGNCYITGSGGILVLVLEDQTITTVKQANAWLAQQKEAGTPVAVNYLLAVEELEEYSTEQKAIYSEILRTAKSYKEKTHIFSADEISPKFEVEYYKDIEAYVISEIKGGATNG